MNYYTTDHRLGKVNVSSNVFVDLAKQKLNDLVKNEFKDVISLSMKDKKENIVCTIDGKNNIKVNVAVNGYRNKDVNAAIIKIQQAIYEAMVELTEISNINVNISLVGFVD